MKRKNYLILAITALVMSSCFSNSSKIEYIPCKVDKGDDWGFVNAKGEVVCTDQFTERPTYVREGIFFAKENDAYAMYKFDTKKPVMILDNLAAFGFINEGLVPVCKNDSHIEIVDAKGKTQFVLNKIDDRQVVSCAPSFRYGYLIVETMDKEGNKLSGMVNKSGEVIIKPQYKSIFILSNNLFSVSITNENGRYEHFFIDKNGEKQTQWKKNVYHVCSSSEYIVVEKDDRYYVYDWNGNEVLKCPTKVSRVLEINDNYIIFENDDYKSGVMDLNGEVVIPAKYYNLSFIDNGFLARRGYDRDYELLNKTGERIATLDDINNITILNGFAFAKSGSSFYVLNDKLELINKNEFYAIDYSYSFIEVQSDYLDYSEVVSVIKEFLEGECAQLHFGTSVTQINDVTKRGTGSFDRYAYEASKEIAEGVKYEINANLIFDQRIVSPIYREKRVEKYNRYYGTYYTTETVVSGYQFNSDSELSGIEIECEVPSSKEEKMYEELVAFLNTFAKGDYNLWYKDGRAYELDGLTIRIALTEDMEYTEDI